MGEEKSDVTGMSISQIVSAFFSLIGFIFKPARTFIRRKLIIRRAAKDPLSISDDHLDLFFDRAFSSLYQEEDQKSWWRKISSITNPDFLEHPGVQEWLTSIQVREDIKILARDSILSRANKTNPEIMGRLRKSLKNISGKEDSAGVKAILQIRAILVKRFESDFDTQGQHLSYLIQSASAQNEESHRDMRNELDAIKKNLAGIGRPDIHAIKAHTDIAKQQLAIIKKTRSLNSEGVREKISHLIQRIEEGDLSQTDRNVSEEIYYWRARLHAREDLLSLAKEYRKNIKAFSKKAIDVLDALIKEAEGDKNSALQELRDIKSDDGRATLFIKLHAINGEAEAVRWFDEQKGKNDLDFVTGIGCSNIAITLAKIGRVEEAIQFIGGKQHLINDWPDLAFVEGVINASMLLPKEHRAEALEMDLFNPAINVVEGPNIKFYRSRAEDCFIRAEKLLREVELPQRANAAKAWMLWLRLTDSKESVVHDALEEVKAAMNEGESAINFLPFAIRFNIEFDHTPFIEYLARRKRLGGLNNQELGAELMFYRFKKEPKEFLEFLDREQEKIKKIIPDSTFIGLNIEALVSDKQNSQAIRLLEENKEIFKAREHERLRAQIAAYTGDNPVEKLKKIYSDTKSLLDLKNLTNILSEAKDWPMLKPFLYELFEKERTTENARRLVTCMQRGVHPDYQEIIRFIDENSDITHENQELMSSKAWALFNLSDLENAKIINDDLLKKRDVHIDALLDINIAVKLGDWEKFPVIIDREWPKRENLDAEVLIYLARLAAEIDLSQDRAFELASLAASKSLNNPKILLSAYTLAIQIDREEEAATQWMIRAIELSDENGPVQSIDMKSMAEEWMPVLRERSEIIQQDFFCGRMPLYETCMQLNLPLSRFLLDLPNANYEQADGRNKNVIPIISGVRGREHIQSTYTLALDITSIFVLYQIGMLDALFQSVKEVLFASDVMITLLNERRRARFHQPSRIRRAEEIRNLIDQNNLNSISSNNNRPPNWLIEEVGSASADLLDSAKNMNGKVIFVDPIYKIRTFNKEKAELKDYAQFTLPILTFIRVLNEKGLIESELYARAKSYLAARAQIDDQNITISDLKIPIFVTDVALAYLQDIGLLNTISKIGLEIFIHPSTRKEQELLISENQRGENLEKKISDIRRILNKALKNNRASLISKNAISLNLNDSDESEYQDNLIFRLAKSVDNVDAICVDDRYYNTHPFLIDEKGKRIKVLCTFDVLHHLKASGIITENRMFSALSKMRKSGFSFIPLEREELEHIVYTSIKIETSEVVETAEKRILKQSLMCIRSIDSFMSLQEQKFINSIRLNGIYLIQGVWKNNKISIETAKTISNWIWRYVIPSPLDWAHVFQKDSGILIDDEAEVRHIGLLLYPLIEVESARARAYYIWVEDDVVKPLLPANNMMLERLAEISKRILLMLSDIPE